MSVIAPVRVRSSITTAGEPTMRDWAEARGPVTAIRTDRAATRPMIAFTFTPPEDALEVHHRHRHGAGVAPGGLGNGGLRGGTDVHEERARATQGRGGRRRARREG